MPAVREIEHEWIPMPDGSRLAARLWLPDDADRFPVPAILEYIPYRKRDFTRARDDPMHRWFAARGYAAVRVDVRGSGESDGILRDEYAEEELADGLAVIAWIAAQPWCTGAVGMIGKSWGGFNALQIAARRPPALRAVITVCGSDDRYADDAHYMGGCLLNENLTWGTALLASSALPPDPALVGERWRATWLARLEQVELFPHVWLRHQQRDAYWRRGSVCEDPSAIACAVYAVGGWADAYTNAIPRLLATLGAPRKGLVGPWGHVYPQSGVPGPAIGFLPEALRWWERWLSGRDSAMLDEPVYRAWMAQGDGTGRWVAEAVWPSSRIRSRRYALNPGRLGDAPGAVVPLRWRSPQSVGVGAGDWCSFGGEGETPGEQGDDDAGSLVFDSAPLGERIEILGAPVVVLHVSVDRPRAFVAVRLNEVSADGSSRRVTYGVLNLTHRAGHDRVEALEPGRRYEVRIVLNEVAHSFAVGSRLRLALSTAYWPIVWPSPEAVTLTVFAGASALEVPVRPPAPEDGRLRAFGEPDAARAAGYTESRPARVERMVERDRAGAVVQTIVADAATRIEATDVEITHGRVRRYRIREDDPVSAEASIVERMGLRRGKWAVRVEAHAGLSASRDTFALRARLDAWEGDTLVRTRSWDERIPRDGV